jgi:acetyltransferase-like isoleucine patch superfamily enzyme
VDGNLFDSGYFETAELRSSGFASVGENVRIAKNCNIVGLENIHVGDNVRIDPFCSLIALGGFIKLGSYIHIGGYCHLSGRGGITMGDFSGLSQRVNVYSASDDYSGRHMTNPMVPAHLTGARIEPVVIGRHAIVGAGSVILPGVTLHEGVAVGSLALVTHSQPEWTICGGVPARKMSERKRNPLALEHDLSRSESMAG